MVGSSSAGSDSRVKSAVLLPSAPPVETMTSLTASRDLATVQEAIRVKYGFVAPAAYCFDLIRFVEALTDGQ